MKTRAAAEHEIEVQCELTIQARQASANARTMAEAKSEKVQCFGRKKTAVAVALVRTDRKSVV